MGRAGTGPATVRPEIVVRAHVPRCHPVGLNDLPGDTHRDPAEYGERIGSTVVFSCYNSLRAIQVTRGASGASPRLRMLWSAPGANPGPPIIAGEVVWDLSGQGILAGYRLPDGHSVFTAQSPSPETRFPSPSASGARLLVPGGDKVVSYLGI